MKQCKLTKVVLRKSLGCIWLMQPALLQELDEGQVGLEGQGQGLGHVQTAPGSCSSIPQGSVPGLNIGHHAGKLWVCSWGRCFPCMISASQDEALT